MAKQAKREVRAALLASRSAFLMTGVFSFFISLLMLTAPLYMLQVYDRVLASRSESTLVVLTVLAGALLLVMGLLDLVRARVLVRVGSKIDSRLSARVFSAVFNDGLCGRRGARSQSLRDLDALRQFLTGPGPFALFDAPWAPIFLVVVFLFHPLLGLVALIGSILLFGLAFLNELTTRQPLLRANAEAVAANGFAEASLRNAEVLEALGMQPAIQKRWINNHCRAMVLQASASDRAATLTSFSKALRLMLQVAVLAVGAALAIQQVITPGIMIAASILMGRALAPIELAIGQWRHFVGARQAYRRLDRLLRENLEGEASLTLPPPEGHLIVEQLVAAPPGVQRPVIKGVSFRLEPGEALGVIGASASGKSTLARLLVGVWQPRSGSVRLDSAEVHRWSSEELGPYIGYLPQDVELFDGNVAENISRFSEAATPEAVVAAARCADVHELVLKLDGGYETQIGENGCVLSGGQRQRIGLARALYGEPVLVVLDEPNASLDAAGDSALTQAILGLKRRGATVVVMAHRPSAIAAVDKLLMLRDGTIEAFGAKDEVLAQVTKVPATTPVGNVAAIRPGP